MNCPSCGRQVDTDSRFCKHCAFDLSTQATKSDSANSQKGTKPKRTVLLVGLAFVGILVLGILGTYIYKTRQVQATNGITQTSTATTASNASNTTRTTVVSSNAPQQNQNTLTNERVLAAVQKAFNKLVRSDHMASGASAKVIGIQDIPAANAARADLDLTNAAFLQTDMLSGKWELGPGGYGGRMVYSKKRIRIDNCTANLKHYNSGKWVLESLDTHSYEFGVVTVNVGVD